MFHFLQKVIYFLVYIVSVNFLLKFIKINFNIKCNIINILLVINIIYCLIITIKKLYKTQPLKNKFKKELLLLIFLIINFEN